MFPSLNQLTRKKVVDFGHSELRRVLGILDLTMLGVGSTIGVGIYVLAGQVSRDTSGPAVTLSFLIAAVASLFAGLCYAEFGARVPKAGSAYIYTYVCIGEFLAFIIGWNLILEYVIGTASVARGFSQYVDALADHKISNASKDAMPMGGGGGFLSPYPDFLSFGLSIFLSVALALGVKESSRMNNLFTGINIIVILFVIIAAGTQGNLDNWKLSPDELEEVCKEDGADGSTDDSWGAGGFVPFGFDGIMEGAATCFFGFVGFDIIATTGEEALNPAKTIPISIGASLLIIFLSYFGVSAVITLAVPYCLQDKDAPLVALFDSDHIGWEGAKWFVSIGALFGFSASLFGAMFPLPRVLYAMASDGLLFRSLSSVSRRFQTPTLATALSGLFAGTMAMLFNLEALVKMMSIGTLMAYTIVAVCVMLLRYTAGEEDEERERESSSVPPVHSFSNYMGQLFNPRGLTTPTDLTSYLVTYAILCFCVLVLVLDVLLVTLSGELSAGDPGAISAVVILVVLNLFSLVVIARQPVSSKKLSFKVPFVPWVPAISTFINLYLMCNLPSDTWIRFAIWMAIGFLDYFGYGLWNSSLRGAGGREGGGGDTKQGLDNLGYSADGPKNHKLVIPKIEIQPATPQSSEPSTPAAKPKHRSPAPPSPLSTPGKDTDVESGKSGSGDGAQLDTAAVLISLMKKVQNEAAARKIEETKTTSGADETSANDFLEGNDAAEINRDANSVGVDVNGAAVVFRSEGNGGEHERIGDVKEQTGSDVVSGNVYTSTSPLSTSLFNTTKAEGFNSELQLSESSALKEDNNDSTSDKIVSKMEDMKDSNSNETSSKMEDMKDSNSDKIDNTNLADTKRNKPPPLTLINTDNDNNTEIPRAYSSPELSPPPSPPPSSPSSIPPPLPTTSPPRSPISLPARRLPPPLIRSQSETNLYHGSGPTTPSGRRHPFKVLSRKSSFDHIPPCSPDSPHARRIASFLVIPVPEPDSNDSSSASIKDNSEMDPQANDLSQAVDKLNKYRTEGGQKLFTVGSADSLDNVADSDDFLTARRGLLREPEILDPIRERGESKLYVTETNEKTELPQDQSELTNHAKGPSAILNDTVK